MMMPVDDGGSGRSPAQSSTKNKSSLQKGNEKEKNSNNMSLASHLKRFDIYTKLEEDYKIQTSGGATVSIVGWLIMAILIFGEFRSYMTPTVKEHMIVDTSLGQRLRVNINMTFHALTCADVHLDAMDVAGISIFHASLCYILLKL
jgi:hypothetical protein